MREQNWRGEEQSNLDPTTAKKKWKGKDEILCRYRQAVSHYSIDIPGHLTLQLVGTGKVQAPK